MGAVAMQRGMDGVTEAMTPERGSMSVMMERGTSAAMGSNARENHWTSGSVDRQSVCGAGVMGAGSVRTGMGLKMFTAGMNSLMVAAGDKAAAVLVGRETSAAKGKLQLVSLRLKKKEGSKKDRICRNLQSCRMLPRSPEEKKSFFSQSSSLSFNTSPLALNSLIAASRFFPLTFVTHEEGLSSAGCFTSTTLCP